jgi:hypothetical protein
MEKLLKKPQKQKCNFNIFIEILLQRSFLKSQVEIQHRSMFNLKVPTFMNYELLWNETANGKCEKMSKLLNVE